MKHTTPWQNMYVGHWPLWGHFHDCGWPRQKLRTAWLMIGMPLWELSETWQHQIITSCWKSWTTKRFHQKQSWQDGWRNPIALNTPRSHGAITLGKSGGGACCPLVAAHNKACHSVTLIWKVYASTSTAYGLQVYMAHCCSTLTNFGGQPSAQKAACFTNVVTKYRSVSTKSWATSRDRAGPSPCPVSTSDSWNLKSNFHDYSRYC